MCTFFLLSLWISTTATELVNNGWEFHRLETHSPVKTKLYSDTDEVNGKEWRRGGQKEPVVDLRWSRSEEVQRADSFGSLG